jgi:type I restriction-modification system DNA methylase subunit
MGVMFEELIRRFAELSNETAGEHFTPREVIRLMVNLLFVEDDEALTKPGVVRTLYDPTAGTGDYDKTKVGNEIPFNRHFYVYKPPRPLAEIDAELKVVTDRIVAMIAELSN